MLEALKNKLFHNWQTTTGAVCAILGTGLMAASSVFEASGGHFDVGAMLSGVGAAVIGLFGKDAK